MKSTALLARIAMEPGKMGGKPIIRGRRVTPSMVLNVLAKGATRADVLEAYAVLEPEDIDAVCHTRRASANARPRRVLRSPPNSVRILADADIVPG
jgi:uncharacterized protein (DUF433 family)